MSATAAEEAISIVPNPNNGVFQIQLPMLEAAANLIITDVQGKVVRKTTISQDQSSVDVNMSELGKGVYFINVSDGQHTYKAKFIAE
jgi:flagellar hook assembly protein FlgD